MRCLLHRWDKWEDVEPVERRKHHLVHVLVYTPRQQRRCLRCNRLETRYT